MPGVLIYRVAHWLTNTEEIALHFTSGSGKMDLVTGNSDFQNHSSVSPESSK